MAVDAEGDEAAAVVAHQAAGGGEVTMRKKVLTEKPRILNIRDFTGGKPWPKDTVSIMRPSVYGNPYRMEDSSREDCIVKFKAYVKRSPALVELAQVVLRGRNLMCCCAPLQCHGDVWLKVANGPMRKPSSNG